MNNWFLFIGVIFVCSGFLMPLGVIMLVWYFIDLIFKKGAINTGTQYNDNTYNINNLNVNSNSGHDKDDFDTPMEHMSKDVREEMR